MSQSKKPDRRQLFDGRARDSLFSTPFLLFFRQDELSNLLQKVEHLNDHRLLAITTALVVENRVDKINAAFLPKYSKLCENSDFTFSTKISLLEALNFIPPHITLVAHCLRKIRNEFAHELEKVCLSDVDTKLINHMYSLYNEIYCDFFDLKSAEEKTPFEVFKILSFFCIAGLDFYIANVKVLRDEISKGEFLEYLGKIVRERNMSEYQRIIAHPPISTERQGNILIKRYEGGVVEVGPVEKS